jgi:hypothetical protein
VREALEMTQPAFAVHLNAAAKRLGLDVVYDALGVSQRETGRRSLDIEDYTIVSAVDPMGRGTGWLAYGTPTRAANHSVLDLDPTRDRLVTDEELDRAERLVAAKDQAKRLVLKRAGGKKK